MEARKVTRFIGLATPSPADPRDKPHWKHKVLPVAAGLMFPNALSELKGMTEMLSTVSSAASGIVDKMGQARKEMS